MTPEIDSGLCTPYPDSPPQCCLCGQMDFGTATDGRGNVIASIEFVLETAYGSVCSECIKQYPDEATVSVYFDEMQRHAAEAAKYVDVENGPSPDDVPDFFPHRDPHTGEPYNE